MALRIPVDRNGFRVESRTRALPLAFATLNATLGGPPDISLRAATGMAALIVQEAIDQLLDALPELELSVLAAELQWRPGPFHRALPALPDTFPKSSADPRGRYPLVR